MSKAFQICRKKLTIVFLLLYFQGSLDQNLISFEPSWLAHGYTAYHAFRRETIRYKTVVQRHALGTAFYQYGLSFPH